MKKNWQLFYAALFFLLSLNSSTAEINSNDQTHAFVVDMYDPQKAYNGTILIPDNYDKDHPRIIEVDMEGEIIWEYAVPDNLKQNTNPGFDVERLQNGHTLITYSRYGIVEIDYAGNVVWEHRDNPHTTSKAGGMWGSTP
jgi:hypothetical protein